MPYYTIIFFALCAVAYTLSQHAVAWWAVLLAWWAMLLSWTAFTPRRWLARVGWIGLLAFIAGAGPVAFAQIEGRFSDEEFFAALQALLLCGEWLLLWLVVALVKKRYFSAATSLGVPRFLVLAMIIGVVAGTVITITLYQRSFYPPITPEYSGFSKSNPFLCGETTLEEAQTYDGVDVFNRLIARVEANPNKGAPEYGMLALAQHSPVQAQAFREALLVEARSGAFTHPANSVKFIQYQASFAVYYFSRVHAVFPDLFSADETALLRDWFAAINRRALTVEWVDWMYALALGEWPTGPYENQENGAGLLALLEQNGLAATDLSTANRAYLSRQARGWDARFRNTDDTLGYQPEWINNAFFQGDQTIYTRLSFEWLLLQALPDGGALVYNSPVSDTLAGVAYLGATLTGDGRYVWLAARELDALEAHGRYLTAQPGVEVPLALKGQAPTQTSCTLYGDSGMPTQLGPLAPDKLILRDSWKADSPYLLLNMRFTGWHRYRATNSIVSVYQAGPLIVEDNSASPITWLPVGRSQVRDKRLPRENLNGLIIGRTGLDSVLHTLTDFGGDWAEDPPFYATVAQFKTTADFDYSLTVLNDWHTWSHQRAIYLYHNTGPIVVMDDASGPPDQSAALVWHTVSAVTNVEGRYLLRTGEHPAEMVVIGGDDIDQPSPKTILVKAAYGNLHLVTVFLFEDWVGAEVNLQGEQVLITQGGRSIAVPMKP